jgi:type II secretory ATPase GspE/PulE/Tfp pilus assembly ATPase PilB-like protein
MNVPPPETEPSRQEPPAPPRGVEEAAVWLARVIEWARERRATDLHLFPSEGEAMLWVRIDGELGEIARYPIAIHERMVARLKVLGRCTDYDGVPVQEGRFQLNGRADGGEARLSVLPTLRGEKAVIRLIGDAARRMKLDDLGYGNALLTALREALDRPQGLMLAIGPGGCGKSTALYALLRDLFERSGRPLSILTIEDPVEQSLPFAAQITADTARGLGFAEGLRALLRQDPEVVMIGEIRDAETATTALQAALTGHRLLSSMHTQTPAEALVRLQQMGAPAYVIGSAVAGVLNVRLLRLLCAECRRLRPPTAAERVAWPELDGKAVVGEAVGCDGCLQTGHLGRIGVGEWCVPSAATTEALRLSRATAEIAVTMRRVAAARPALLDPIAAGRIAPGEPRRLNGIAIEATVATEAS